MYKHFLVTFLLISSIIKSQINIQQLSSEWLKIKTLMIDGSKDVSEPFLTSKFYRWNINNHKICVDSDPISANGQTCMDFKIEKNFIRTSPQSGYEIVKLTKDSLIIIERINGIEENDKIRKHWFSKSSSVKNQYIEKYKTDSILVASENFTPTLNKNFILNIHSEFKGKNNYPVFNLIGNIVFYPKKGNMDVQIVNSTDKDVTKNQKNIELIKSMIAKTYNNWNLSDFKNFDKVYLPFIIKSYYENVGDGWSSKGTPIYYFIDNISDINKIYGIKIQDLRIADDNFRNGVKAIQDSKYDKAINYFNKSYEIDTRKIDALYNIANIYLFKKDLINECIYLQKLKDLEQVEGIKRYNEKCEKL